MRNALAHAGRSGRRVVSALIATAFAQDHFAVLLDEAEEVLAYLNILKEHRAAVDSTNPWERINGEIDRRTEVPLPPRSSIGLLETDQVFDVSS